MDIPEETEKALQWHPAFFAGIQIELEEEADQLVFENEHQLGTKPKEIDVLIIKKEADRPIRKNIGRIFRKHNLVEYKSPTDYLSIDDFYKVYGYACFYKADTDKMDKIRVEELTITYVSSRYPKKLMEHLKKHQYKISEESDGIYYITGNQIPMQLIVQSRLPKDENLWLRSLTDQIDSQEEIAELAEAYGKKKNQNLYQSVMNIIIRANREKFQEVKNVCEALEELFKEDLVREKNEGKIEGKEVTIINQVLCKMKKQLDVATIAEHLEEPETQIQKIVDMKLQHPEADGEEVLKLLQEEKGK